MTCCEEHAGLTDTEDGSETALRTGTFWAYLPGFTCVRNGDPIGGVRDAVVRLVLVNILKAQRTSSSNSLPPAAPAELCLQGRRAAEHLPSFPQLVPSVLGFQTCCGLLGKVRVGFGLPTPNEATWSMNQAQRMVGRDTYCTQRQG